MFILSNEQNAELRRKLGCQHCGSLLGSVTVGYVKLDGTNYFKSECQGCGAGMEWDGNSLRIYTNTDRPPPWRPTTAPPD